MVIPEHEAHGLTLVMGALPLSLQCFGVQSHWGSLQGLLEKLSAVGYSWKSMDLEQCGREVGHNWGEEISYPYYFIKHARCLLVQVGGLDPCPLKLM